MKRAFSHSQLKQYEDLPLAWKFAKIDKLPEEASVPMLVGQAAHTAAKEYLERCWRSKLPSDAAIVDEVVDKVKLDRAPPNAGGHPRGGPALMFKFAETFRHSPGRLRVPAGVRRALARGRVVRQVRPVPRRDGPVRPALADSRRDHGLKTGWKMTARRTRRTTRSSASTRSWPRALPDGGGDRGEALARPVRVRAGGGVRKEDVCPSRTNSRRAWPRSTRRRTSRRRRGPLPAVFLPPPVPRVPGERGLTEIPEDGVALAHAFALAKARVKELEEAVKVRVDASGPIDLGTGGCSGTRRPSGGRTRTRAARVAAPRTRVPNRTCAGARVSKTDVVKMLRAVKQKGETDAVLDAFGSGRLRLAPRVQGREE